MTEEKQNKQTVQTSGKLILVTMTFIIVMIAPLNSQEGSASDQFDRRKEILLYGIHSEVLAVLGELSDENIGSFNDLLTTVMEETRDSSTKQAIYRLWRSTDYDGGLALARSELLKVVQDEDFNASVIQTAMAYLADENDEEALPYLMEILEHRDLVLAAGAVRAIGKIGLTGDLTAEPLLDRLKTEDPVVGEDIISALIVTLGDLKYGPAADMLVLIAEDEGASSGHRRFACVSVGKIGREEDYKVIQRIYYDADDAILRSYALAGLAEFPGKDISEMLIQALKRDSFWRIRVTAAEKLAVVDGDGVSDLLRYKAANDTIPQVRIASLKSLGALGGRENSDFLLDYFKDEKRSTETRLTALMVLVENRLSGTVDAVNQVMMELWEKDQGRFLEFVCRDLSRGDWDELAPLYERMLDHPNWLLQVYGIRGIRRNGIASLNSRVEALDTEATDSRVLREIGLDN